VPYYESVFIARQDISAPQVETLAETFTKALEGHGGKVTKVENWGLRSLAYKIKKNRKGHYVLFNIDAPSEAVLEMERQMRINEDVLRYLTLRVDELEEGPSVMMHHRGGREDRPRRGERHEARDSGGSRNSSGSEASAEKDKEKQKDKEKEKEKDEAKPAAEGDDT